MTKSIREAKIPNALSKGSRLTSLRVTALSPAVAVSELNRPDSSPSLRKAGAAKLLHFKASRDLLEPRLTGSLGQLFKKLTGLRLHVLWHQPFDFRKSGPALKLCPTVRSQCRPRDQMTGTCQTCLERDGKLVAPPPGEERRFVGPCGLTTFRVGLPAGGIPFPLTMMLQARIKTGRAGRRPGVSAAAFARAVDLLRLICRDLAMTLRASAAEANLNQLQRRLKVLAREAARLHQPFRHRSKSPVVEVQPTADTHAQQIVQEMVAYVHEHYHRPMSLGHVAAALKMNAAYLCDLFSRHLGVTLHHYLVEVRMAKARELMLDPRRRICEVASAVGYASADQFRHAFKAHAGVPPSAWR